MERGSDGEWSILATPDAAVPPVAVGILGAEPACQLLAPPTRRISNHEEADAVVEEDDEAGEEIIAADEARQAVDGVAAIALDQLRTAKTAE